MSKFKPGQSGNPAGRPKGTGQAAQLREAIADSLDDIIEAMVQQAKAGDVNAAKMLIDKVLPNIKPAELPAPIAGVTQESGGDYAERCETILAQVERGELTAAQATQAMAVIDQARQMSATTGGFDTDWNFTG